MIQKYTSPAGELTVVCAQGAVRLCDWNCSRLLASHLKALTSAIPDAIDSGTEDDKALMLTVSGELDSYFRGEGRGFSVPAAPVGTQFRQAVWQELRHIPYGTVVSYAGIARRLGKPGAARAVGAACGANPVSIIIPCHRVVSAAGSLTGYAGGIRAKEFLLRLEKND